MNILLIGGGGREHALASMLARSASAKTLWCAPGNGGISDRIECLPLDLDDVAAAGDMASLLHANLTIVGPELPLVLGIADAFASRGLALLGPNRKAAQLEGSKIFAKDFLERHGIPTAHTYGVCETLRDVEQAIRNGRFPLVLKADGLCAGKGVLVTSSPDEALLFAKQAIEGREFGDAGSRLLIGEALPGEELSFIILTDGENFIRMAPARDHKRAYDNDTGPNTGGMGAYSIDELLPRELEQQIVDSVVHPTLRGLREQDIRYRGFLYFGLMLTAEGPKVLEYNCRLGDPETQAVLLRADFDFAEACYRAATGTLEGFEAKWLPGASACVVLASEGYPSQLKIGREITGLSNTAESATTAVFHAGTRRANGSFYSTGGRVLAAAAIGSDLDEALARVYKRISSISLEGSFYRRDIGAAARKSRAGVSA